MKKEITKRQCEAIIQEGLDAISKVDRALSIIQQMKLLNNTQGSIHF